WLLTNRQEERESGRRKQRGTTEFGVFDSSHIVGAWEHHVHQRSPSRCTPSTGVPDLHLIVDALEVHLGAKPPVLRCQSVLPMCTCEVWVDSFIQNLVLTWITYQQFDLGFPSIWLFGLAP
ncbi:hypothetical protein XENORESO_004567, partial [Xenotaenia resolanae]